MIPLFVKVVTVWCCGQWKYCWKFMKDKVLLVNLTIHHEYQWTEGLCNNQGSNWFFTKTIHSVVTLYLLTMIFLLTFILSLFCHEEKKCQTLLLIFSAVVAWPGARAVPSQGKQCACRALTGLKLVPARSLHVASYGKDPSVFLKLFLWICQWGEGSVPCPFWATSAWPAPSESLDCA